MYLDFFQFERKKYGLIYDGEWRSSKNMMESETEITIGTIWLSKQNKTKKKIRTIWHSTKK